MRKNPTVSIVLPLYQPKDGWVKSFARNVSNLENHLPGEQIEFIVVHDGPPDEGLFHLFDSLSKTFEALTFISYRQNRGKGFALRQGVAVAQAPYVLTVDFDFPYKMENIVALIRQLQMGNDVVVGRRCRSYFRQLPLKRKLISRSFSLLNGLFFNLPLNDTQSGIKGFNANGKEIFLQTFTDRFLVDTEFLLRASRQLLSVKIIDIQLNPDVTFSSFGLKVIRTELKNFVRLVKLNRKLYAAKPEWTPAVSL